MITRHIVESIAAVVEGAGVTVILVSVVAAAAAFAVVVRRARVYPEAYRAARQTLGRGILLGLEVLVAADIVRTIAVGITLESLAVLAGIVAIRVVLSFALEVELEGRWPWRRQAG